MKVHSAVGVFVAAQRPDVHVVPLGHAVAHTVGGRQRFAPLPSARHARPSVAQLSRATTPPWQLTRVVPSQRPAAVSVAQPSVTPVTKQSANPDAT